MKKRPWLLSLLLSLIVLILSGCVDTKAVAEVDRLIAAIGKVDLESEAAIVAAEESYSQLSEESQAEVSNLQALLDAREAYDIICKESEEAVAEVDQLIEAIGKVDLESEAAIVAAEEAYSQLSEEDQAKVSNLQALLDARNEISMLREAMMPYIGEWVNVQSLISAITYTPEPSITYISLKSDGTVSLSTKAAGDWRLNSSVQSIQIQIGNTKKDATLTEEDGYTFLHYAGCTWVRREDRAAYQRELKDLFVYVSVTRDNFRDYIGEPYRLGKVKNTNLPSDWGLYYWIDASAAYSNGLVYVSCNNFSIQREESMFNISARIYTTMTSFEPFKMTYSWGPGGLLQEGMDLKITLGDQASGLLIFVREEYVEKNYISNDGYRTLNLVGGYTIVDYSNNWNNVQADYDSHKY